MGNSKMQLLASIQACGVVSGNIYNNRLRNANLSRFIGYLLRVVTMGKNRAVYK